MHMSRLLHLSRNQDSKVTFNSSKHAMESKTETRRRLLGARDHERTPREEGHRRLSHRPDNVGGREASLATQDPEEGVAHGPRVCQLHCGLR